MPGAAGKRRARFGDLLPSWLRAVKDSCLWVLSEPAQPTSSSQRGFLVPATATMGEMLRAGELQPQLEHREETLPREVPQVSKAFQSALAERSRKALEYSGKYTQR